MNTKKNCTRRICFLSPRAKKMVNFTSPWGTKIIINFTDINKT